MHLRGIHLFFVLFLMVENVGLHKTGDEDYGIDLEHKILKEIEKMEIQLTTIRDKSHESLMKIKWNYTDQWNYKCMENLNETKDASKVLQDLLETNIKSLPLEFYNGNMNKKRPNASRAPHQGFSSIPELFKEINSKISNITKNEFDKFLRTIGNIFLENNMFLEQLQKQVIANTKDQVSKMKQNLKNEIELPKDCKEAQNRGETLSGTYRIRPDPTIQSFLVWCDMKTHGGGWTYIFKRFNGSQNFQRKWTDYKYGFGILTGEFWLGLKYIYYLTEFNSYELLVELVYCNNTVAYAAYDDFYIGNEEEGYALHSLGKYSGNAGNSLVGHLHMKFSTEDRDQDESEKNCAEYNHGGWWFNKCHSCLLTGLYIKCDETKNEKFVSSDIYSYLREFKGSKSSLKSAKMMIRPKM